jgi:hypothetical protein
MIASSGVTMRLLLVLPVLVATLACGSTRLSKREAESDIRKDYPVAVLLKVAETAKAVKGSPEHAKLVSLQEGLTRAGWFSVTRAAEGDREQFTFKRSDKAPASVQSAPGGGFQMVAAEAEFVRAVSLDSRGSEARVTYQIRLVRPTAAFPMFQAQHPGVRAGDAKERHATYRREGRSWVLQGTDEAFKKAR